MNNVELMKVRDTCNYMLEESAGLKLIQFGLLYNVVE